MDRSRRPRFLLAVMAGECENPAQTANQIFAVQVVERSSRQEDSRVVSKGVVTAQMSCCKPGVGQVSVRQSLNSVACDRRISCSSFVLRLAQGAEGCVIGFEPVESRELDHPQTLKLESVLVVVDTRWGCWGTS